MPQRVARALNFAGVALILFGAALVFAHPPPQSWFDEPDWDDDEDSAAAHDAVAEVAEHGAVPWEDVKASLDL